MDDFRRTFADPPREFSLLPFWIWDDELSEAGLRRQLDAFEASGVYGFVIDGLLTGGTSGDRLGLYRVAIDEAGRRDMRVLLSDRGVDHELGGRCLAVQGASDPMPASATVVQAITGTTKVIVDRPAAGGLTGGDRLDRRTADAIIERVYNRFHAAFGALFGTTILGIYTDGPDPLGDGTDVFPYTTGILPHLEPLLGYDFAPHLPELWADEGQRLRADYRRAIRRRLHETWYHPLSAWCEAKGIALCGHPHAGDDIGTQRFFQIPGQGLAWGRAEPDQPSALEGPDSTQAKGTSSAMAHAGRRRNGNAIPDATLDGMRWLANWCLIRGVNLLMPHAAEWDATFKPFADHCRRVSWLNTDSRMRCDVAILTHDDRRPWRAAKALLTHQRDFGYLDPATLLAMARVEAGRLVIGPMRYAVVVIDGHAPLPDAVRARLLRLSKRGAVLRYGDGPRPDGLPVVRSTDELVAAIDARVPPAYLVRPATASLRLRTVDKDGHTVVMAFNESGHAPIDVTLYARSGRWVDPAGAGDEMPLDQVRLHIPAGDLVLRELVP